MVSCVTRGVMHLFENVEGQNKVGKEGAVMFRSVISFNRRVIAIISGNSCDFQQC